MIYLFLQEGFEEVEAMAPIDILRRAGADLKTVGENGRMVKSSHGITVEADLESGDVTFTNMDMVILPGGPGTSNHEKSRVVRGCTSLLCRAWEIHRSHLCSAVCPWSYGASARSQRGMFPGL